MGRTGNCAAPAATSGIGATRSLKPVDCFDWSCSNPAIARPRVVGWHDKCGFVLLLLHDPRLLRGWPPPFVDLGESLGSELVEVRLIDLVMLVVHHHRPRGLNSAQAPRRLIPIARATGIVVVPAIC
jgi:hypothetical protein